MCVCACVSVSSWVESKERPICVVSHCVALQCTHTHTSSAHFSLHPYPNPTYVVAFSVPASLLSPTLFSHRWDGSSPGSGRLCQRQPPAFPRFGQGWICCERSVSCNQRSLLNNLLHLPALGRGIGKADIGLVLLYLTFYLEKSVYKYGGSTFFWSPFFLISRCSI